MRRAATLLLALMASTALAQAGVCRDGAFCQPWGVYLRSAATNTHAQTCWQNATNAVQVSRASQWLNFGVGASCGAAPTAYPMAFDTVVTPRVDLGNGYALTFTGYSSVAGLPAPSLARGLAAVGFGTGALWHSDGAAWRPVGDAADPVASGRTWLFDWSDGAPVWVFGTPHTSAFGAVARTVTCTGGTEANQTAALGLFQTPVRRLTTQGLTNAVCAETFALGQRAPVVVNRWRAIASVGPASLASIRFVVGMNAAATVFTAPSTAPTTEGVWFRYFPELGDTAYQACSSGGSATTCTSTGVTVVAGTAVTFEVDMTEVSAVNFSVNGIHRARHTTNVPVSAADMTFGTSVQTLTAAALDANRGRFELFWR